MYYDNNTKRKNFASSPQQSSGNRKKEEREAPDAFLSDNAFKQAWITVGADEGMITFADKAGKYMAPLHPNGDRECLSKAQIRNVFGEIKRIQLKGIDKPEGRSAFLLLKPKVAYAEGRNRTKGLTLFKKIFDKGWQYAGKSQATYNNFCALLEAILAYHKAYGGKD